MMIYKSLLLLCLCALDLVFDAVCIDLRGDFFKLVIHLEYAFVENGLVDVVQESARFVYRLHKLKIRYSIPAEEVLRI